MTKKVVAQKGAAGKKKAPMKAGVKTGMVVAGATALAAAGYYFFYGSKDGAGRRKKVAAWSGKLKREVIEKSRELKDLNQKSIAAIVKSAGKAYETVQTIDRADLTAAMKELQHNWEEIKREAEKKVTTKATAVKKAAKKAVKKALK